MASFTGGRALEAKLEEIARKVSSAGTLRVGFLEGATYPDGTPVPYIAALNEFGDLAHNQPPRPFFRNMIEEKSRSWGGAFGKIAKASDYDMDATLGQMGEGIKGQLQQSITDLTTPALAPSTVRAKGFDKPLIDTGHMQNSVDYEVNQ
ncbi:hypothetical protein [Bordetella sp. 02P26C-1]|uniref:hypothetical protein n=1 Tax=Bordetella sp. 02P26C-1 TaxID=2683195 RepID=UPI0013554C68|nr:hypothetical protein [Bordetella sp. 02P26C-1]MVW80180.1 hypothetical protein [Bordetella sp. 02P26C-1]